MAQHSLNIHFHAAVGQDVARSRMQDMHLLYQGSPRSPLYQFGISPNKLFEYMASGRPILTAGEPAWTPIAGPDFTYRAAPGDPHSVASAILAILGAPPHELQRRGLLARQYVRQCATHSALAEAFLKAIR
jgi:glycosyltransferase involved in cell wall biosynthesis